MFSCNKEQPAPAPTPDPDPTPAIQSFEVTVDAVTKNSVTYSVTPTILDKDYIAVVATKESVASLDDEALVEFVYAELKAAGELKGLTFAEKMAEPLSRVSLRESLSMALL